MNIAAHLADLKDVGIAPEELAAHEEELYLVASLEEMSLRADSQIGMLIPQHRSDGESQVNAGADHRSLVDMLPVVGRESQMEKLQKAVENLTAALKEAKLEGNLQGDMTAPQALQRFVRRP